MRVEKWYLDCVAADGGGFIGYAARLGWGRVAVRCSEMLAWERDGRPRSSGLRWGGAPPEPGREELQWNNRAIDVSGRWHPVAPAFAPRMLHEEEAGCIEWHCCCPAAQAAVEAAGVRREGLGYAERLVVALPPARLPFRELHWGRFLTGDQHCVWIVWRGATPRTWVFHQGALVTAEIDNGPRLRWPGHELHVSPGLTLRHGTVAGTVFRRAPLLRRLFPAALGRVTETKWCSRGVLAAPGGRTHAGWAIHEVALFP